ncbi:MAG: zinc protease [Cycloclasticus sp. symbiont of Bathymodiolus heckerae]|nr:MAG: zinc protease [Cycloclasticus sp. symbiont of Bathymodiolus heckerae]
MRINSQCFIAGLLFLINTACFAVPTIQHWQTSNGVNVYFIPTDGLSILDARLVFDAGSVRDGSKKGVAALTSNMLDQGAAGQSAQDIAERLESVGAQLGTSTSRDFTSISFRSLTDQNALEPSWNVLKEVLNEPNFPIVDFSREKKRTLLSITRREESPGTLAQLALYKEIFKGHAYASAIQGEESTVSQLVVKDLQNFYQQYYVASNLKVILVGGLSKEQAQNMVEELVGDLPLGVKANAISKVNDVQRGVAIHQEYPSQQTHMMYSTPVLKNNDADYFALYVGNHILGGSGFSSRIVKEIREKRGLAYSAYSYFHPMVEKGPFLMGLQTRNEKASEAASAVKQTLKSFIEEGPTEEELIAAKKNIMGGFALKLDSNKKLLANVVGIVASGASLDYLNNFMGQVKAVTREQVIDAFQRRVKMNSMVMVTVGQALPNKE